MAKTKPKYINCMTNHGNVVMLRETASYFIDDFGQDKYEVVKLDNGETEKIRIEFERYKKVPDRFYPQIAETNNGSYCGNTQIYALDSDFSIKKLGEKVLEHDHPNKDYIKSRYNDLKFIAEVQKRAIEKIQNCKTFDQCQNLNDLFDLGVRL